MDGNLQTARAILAGRIREAEVHHVDLGPGYLPSDWPPEFVEQQMAFELPKVTDRTNPAELLGWITGRRGPAPTLNPWR